MADARENCIEWINGDKTISVTLNQKRLITKVEKMAQKHPDLVQILDRNSDGSIFAHLPLKALKLSIIKPTGRAFTDADDDDCERMCTYCGKVMDAGYVVNDGEEYYCSEECFNTKYDKESLDTMYNEGSAYWTEWGD